MNKDCKEQRELKRLIETYCIGHNKVDQPDNVDYGRTMLSSLIKRLDQCGENESKRAKSVPKIILKTANLSK